MDSPDDFTMVESIRKKRNENAKKKFIFF